MTSKGYNLIIHDQQEYNDFKQLLLESDDKKILIIRVIELHIF